MCVSVCVSVCVCAAVKAGQAVLLFAQVALTPRNRVLSTVGANGPSYRCCWGGLVITLVVTVTHTKIQPHTHTHKYRHTHTHTQTRCPSSAQSHCDQRSEPRGPQLPAESVPPEPAICSQSADKSGFMWTSGLTAASLEGQDSVVSLINPQKHQQVRNISCLLI